MPAITHQDLEAHMRIPHPLLLAFVGSLTLVESKYVPSIDHDASNTAGIDHPKSPGLAGM